MKRFILLLLFFSFPSSIVMACTCANFQYTANDWYITSDFVGTIKITSTSKTPDSSIRRTYMANIKPLGIFKGSPPRRLIVAGTQKSLNWVASCEITMKAGEEWLVAISKDSEGKYQVSYCSFVNMLKSAQGENTSRARDWRTIKHFQFLMKNIPDLHREYLLNERSHKLSDYLDTFEGQSFDGRSAHYLITFYSNLHIKNVTVLRGFNSEFNNKLIAFLKHSTRCEKENIYSKTPPEDEIQSVLGIYYYDDEKKFLSLFDL